MSAVFLFYSTVWIILLWNPLACLFVYAKWQSRARVIKWPVAITPTQSSYWLVQLKYLYTPFCLYSISTNFCCDVTWKQSFFHVCIICMGQFSSMPEPMWTRATQTCNTYMEKHGYIPGGYMWCHYRHLSEMRHNGWVCLPGVGHSILC